MAEQRSSVDGRMRRWLILLALLTSYSVAGKASGNESAAAEDDAIRRAYFAGLSSGADPPGELEIRTFGRTVRLAGSNGAVRRELTCLLCTPQETLSAARSLGAEVRAAVENAPTSAIRIDGRVDGAVTLDDIPVAPPVGEHLVSPGTHDAVLAAGGETRHIRLTLSPGDRAGLSFEDSADSDRRARLRKRWAVVSAGVGLSLAGVGAAFVALHGDCVTLDATCDRKYKSLGPGIGLIAVGALLQGVMIWLLVPRRTAGTR